MTTRNCTQLTMEKTLNHNSMFNFVMPYFLVYIACNFCDSLSWSKITFAIRNLFAAQFYAI